MPSDALRHAVVAIAVACGVSLGVMACDGITPHAPASTVDTAADSQPDPRAQGRANGVASLVPGDVDSVIEIRPGGSSPWGDWLALSLRWPELVKWVGPGVGRLDLASKEGLARLAFDGSFAVAVVRRSSDVAVLGVPASDAAPARALESWIKAETTSTAVSVAGQSVTVIKVGEEVVAAVLDEHGWRVVWPGPAWDGGNADPQAAAERWILAGRGRRLITAAPYVAISSVLGSGGVVRRFARLDQSSVIVGSHMGVAVDVDGELGVRLRGQVYQTGPQRLALRRALRSATSTSPPSEVLASVAAAPIVLRTNFGADVLEGWFAGKLTEVARTRIDKVVARRREQAGVDLTMLGPTAWTGAALIGLERWDGQVLDEFLKVGALRLIPGLFEGVVALEVSDPAAASAALEQIGNLSKRSKVVAEGEHSGRVRVEGEGAPMEACVVGSWLVLASGVSPQACQMPPPLKPVGDVIPTPPSKSDGEATDKAGSDSKAEVPGAWPAFERSTALEVTAGIGLDMQAGHVPVHAFFEGHPGVPIGAQTAVASGAAMTFVAQPNELGVHLQWVVRK